MMVHVVSFYPKNFGAVFSNIFNTILSTYSKIKLYSASQMITHNANGYWVVSTPISNALVDQ